MAFIADANFDAALSRISTNTENLYITSAEATSFAEASSTYKLCTKASPAFTGPADDTSGRKVTVDAITDGTVNATGTAGYWALTDDSASELLATGALASTQGVTSGNTFTLTAIDITIADAS